MAEILIVDDSEAQREALSALMRARGHQVRTADSGESALELVRQQPPEVILLDVVMPGMNGYQVTRKLTNDELTRRIPVILVTSRSLPTDRVWGMRQGATDYITKPVNEDALLAAVDNAIRAA